MDRPFPAGLAKVSSSRDQLQLAPSPHSNVRLAPRRKGEPLRGPLEDPNAAQAPEKAVKTAVSAMRPPWGAMKTPRTEERPLASLAFSRKVSLSREFGKGVRNRQFDSYSTFLTSLVMAGFPARRSLRSDARFGPVSTRTGRTPSTPSSAALARASRGPGQEERARRPPSLVELEPGLSLLGGALSCVALVFWIFPK